MSDTGRIFSGTTSATFRNGTAATLHAMPASFSIFTGWSGACSGTLDCFLYINGDKEVSATFMTDYDHSTFLPADAIYRPSLQAAYDAGSNNDLIKVWGIDFTENLLFAEDKKITISGGHNESYSAIDGRTVLHGTLRVTNGVVNIDRLVIGEKVKE